MKGLLVALPFVLFLAAEPLPAQDTASAPPSCSSPENRQFDFWIGSWTVTNPKGEFVGTNDIVPILGGCALQENWKGKKGLIGTSLNTFDSLERKWHQTWVDNAGTLLVLSGGISDSKMVLSGEQPSTEKPGARVFHRITWTSLDKDHVRQLWESSSDGGKTWSVAFDGLYTRTQS